MPVNIRKTKADRDLAERFLYDISGDNRFDDFWLKIANSETAISAIITSEVAMNLVASSESAMNAIAASQIAMSKIWANDSARQSLWKSHVARLALWNNPAQLRALTVNATPDLISESQLNMDASAGLLKKVAKTGGSGNWTAVNISDSNKYIVWIRFHSAKTSAGQILDWDEGEIASSDHSTDVQTTTGKSSAYGNMNTTSRGLWVWFRDVNSLNGSTYSYARVWYIKV